jgi:hypothetical protein
MDRKANTKRPPGQDAAGAALITARGLTRSYRLGATPVVGVDGVDLDIGAGELVLLKGRSGSPFWPAWTAPAAESSWWPATTSTGRPPIS